jgi:hypothetical protein
MTLRKVYLALAGLALIGELVAASAAAADTPASFSFVVRNTGTEYITRAGTSSSYPGRLVTGDQILSRDVLLQGGQPIGFDNEACTVTFDDNDLCRDMSVFAGRGDVEATWLWVDRNSSEYGPRLFAGVIDGGTGAFTGATGHFAATVLPNGELEITAHLS